MKTMTVIKMMMTMMKAQSPYLEMVFRAGVSILGVDEATRQHVLPQVITHSLEVWEGTGIDSEPAEYTSTPTHTHTYTEGCITKF